jgi:hypothetical protein
LFNASLFSKNKEKSSLTFIQSQSFNWQEHLQVFQFMMSTERKPKAFFTLNLPRKPKDGDVINVQAKLRKNPEL